MQKLIFSLRVTDPARYQTYRDAIAPLMDRHDVAILKEYDVHRSLHSDAEAEEITKIAMFGFPSPEAQTAFFAEPAYQAAKTDFAASTDNFDRWDG